MLPLAATGQKPAQDPRKELKEALRSVLDDRDAIMMRRDNMQRLQGVVSESEAEGGGSRLSLERLLNEVII